MYQVFFVFYEIVLPISKASFSFSLPSISFGAVKPPANALFQILDVESFELAKRDRVFTASVIKVSMYRVGNDHQLFVVGVLAVLYHIVISVFTEIAGVSLFAVDYQYGASYLVRVSQDRLVHKALAADDVPAAV